LAKIIVTMSEPGAFGHPVSGLRFLVVTEGGDRTSIRTDDAGVASVWLPRGSYRFVTPDAITWQNTLYTWDVIVTIQPGTGAIRLSQANAKTVPGTLASPITSDKPSLAPSPGDLPPALPKTKTDSARREGVWIHIGAGYGKYTCHDNCGEDGGGFSAAVAIGGTINPTVQVGGGSNSWLKYEDRFMEIVSTVGPRIRLYPSANAGFFFNFGLGLGLISVRDFDTDYSDSWFGGGGVLGFGIDVPLGAKVSLSPFLNGFIVKTSDYFAKIGQVGIGLTFH
jgi:hypothetical protein